MPDIPKASLDALVERLETLTNETVTLINDQLERLIHELTRSADALETLARERGGDVKARSTDH